MSRQNPLDAFETDDHDCPVCAETMQPDDLCAIAEEAPTTSQECIAAEMRRLRSVRKLGIRAMAKEVGISPATLSRIENGAEPDMKTSRSILRYAGACSCCGAAFAEKAGA